jgi:hypothetical protein
VQEFDFYDAEEFERLVALYGWLDETFAGFWERGEWEKGGHNDQRG